MGIFSRIFGRQSPQNIDAKRVYQKLMTQSRQATFFGEAQTPDSYAGRIEILTMHVSAVMYVLRSHGENGQKLSQALFDVLVEDFDVALRGEGLTDSGVKRRIKPMIEMFYGRLKSFTEGFESSDMTACFADDEKLDRPKDFQDALAVYVLAFNEGLSRLSLGDIAQAKFDFPQLVINPN